MRESCHVTNLSSTFPTKSPTGSLTGLDPPNQPKTLEPTQLTKDPKAHSSNCKPYSPLLQPKTLQPTPSTKEPITLPTNQRPYSPLLQLRTGPKALPSCFCKHPTCTSSASLAFPTACLFLAGFPVCCAIFFAGDWFVAVTARALFV